MRKRRAAFCLLTAGLLLLPSIAGAGAKQPKPEDREIPPDRGSFRLLEKDYRSRLRDLVNAGTPLNKRFDALSLFVLTRDKRVVSKLVKLARNENEPIELRVAILWGLGEIRDPRGMVALQHALAKIFAKESAWRFEQGITIEGRKQKVSLEEMCQGQLARLAEPVVGKLCDALLEPLGKGETDPKPPKEDERTGRLRAALITIAAVGDRDARAVRTLIEILKAEDNYYPWDFKVIAANALSSLVKRRAEELKSVKAHDKMADQIAQGFLEATVVTDIAAVREIAGSTLGQIGWADRAGGTLVAVLRAPNLLKRLRFRTIEALAFIAPGCGDDRRKAIADELIFQLYDTDRNVRWRAAIALGATGDKRAVTFLRRLTHDPDAFVRTKAVAALGHLENPRALPDLAVAMEDPDHRVRRQAALALGRVGRRMAIPALVKKGLKDPHPSVRAMAIVALGYVGRAEGLKAVPPLVKDPDAGVRRVAVQVLDRFLNPGATKALLAALGDDDEKVRSAAIGSAKDRIRRKPSEVLPLIAGAIANGQGNARLGAIQCLAADYRRPRGSAKLPRARVYARLFGDASSPLAAALIAALSDKSPAIRYHAGDLLVDHAWQRKDKEILKRVVVLTSDPDIKVRRVGLKARNYLANLP